ncbi:xylulokinase [Pseudacidobacterium ailaaui]|uniref:xylulokinase n=1 Tax=Pseudacidobacterium ailaaui TaxID=1382359 RepID=UPI00047D7B7E|nr:xylulokinase [Pseudacidobacterium ailaaui]MBX6358832.1 xylulokinase [Pseudacidobacterium ailaaui]MCL6464398.1 xylulokinase [Pseudacidobacterium ailaaui]
MAFLGIDVGTGGTRAVLVDEQGKVIASGVSEHAPFRSPHPGWAEQDPEDWWRAAQEAVRTALSTSGLAGHAVAAVGLTGQMHGAVLLDQEGRVLRPSLIWCDQRTGPQCDWLHQQIGRQRLIELTCNPALPNFTLTKLLWVRDHEPEVYRKIAHVLCPKDYVRYRLTGTYAIDVQEASGTLLLDVTHRRWSEEVARASGVETSWLPQLFESPEVCAHISEEAATRTGLLAGTPVVAGAGDQGAGAVGMGILQPGSVSATIGTSGVVFAATAAPTKDPEGRLHTFCHAVPGRWHVMGVTQAAGLSLRWLRDIIAPGASYDALTAEAEKTQPGSDGLLWAPYLLGERTPHLDSHATALFYGITATHTRGHLVRAVLEGVAYSLKDTLTLFAELGIPVKGIRLGGGGARGQLWRSIQASTYGLPCDVLEAEEGAAFGAALLAGTGAGAWQDTDAACAAAIRVAEQIAPDPEAAKIYADGYEVYRRLYPAIRSIRGEN